MFSWLSGSSHHNKDGDHDDDHDDDDHQSDTNGNDDNDHAPVVRGGPPPPPPPTAPQYVHQPSMTHPYDAAAAVALTLSPVVSPNRQYHAQQQQQQSLTVGMPHVPIMRGGGSGLSPRQAATTTNTANTVGASPVPKFAIFQPPPPAPTLDDDNDLYGQQGEHVNAPIPSPPPFAADDEPAEHQQQQDAEQHLRQQDHHLERRQQNIQGNDGDDDDDDDDDVEPVVVLEEDEVIALVEAIQNHPPGHDFHNNDDDDDDNNNDHDDDDDHDRSVSSPIGSFSQSWQEYDDQLGWETTLATAADSVPVPPQQQPTQQQQQPAPPLLLQPQTSSYYSQYTPPTSSTTTTPTSSRKANNNPGDHHRDGVAATQNQPQAEPHYYYDHPSSSHNEQLQQQPPRAAAAPSVAASIASTATTTTDDDDDGEDESAVAAGKHHGYNNSNDNVHFNPAPAASTTGASSSPALDYYTQSSTTAYTASPNNMSLSSQSPRDNNNEYHAAQANGDSTALAIPHRFDFFSDQGHVRKQLNRVQETSLRRKHEFRQRIHALECTIAQLTARVAVEGMDRSREMQQLLNKSALYQPLGQVYDRLSLLRDSRSYSGNDGSDSIHWRKLETRLSALDTQMTNCIYISIPQAIREQFGSVSLLLEAQRPSDDTNTDDANDHSLSDRSERDKEATATTATTGIAIEKRLDALAGTMARSLHAERSRRIATIEQTAQAIAMEAHASEERAKDFLQIIRDLRLQLARERAERKAQDAMLKRQVDERMAAMARAWVQAMGDPEPEEEEEGATVVDVVDDDNQLVLGNDNHALMY